MPQYIAPFYTDLVSAFAMRAAAEHSAEYRPVNDSSKSNHVVLLPLGEDGINRRVQVSIGRDRYGLPDVCFIPSAYFTDSGTGRRFQMQSVPEEWIRRVSLPPITSRKPSVRGLEQKLEAAFDEAVITAQGIRIGKIIS